MLIQGGRQEMWFDTRILVTGGASFIGSHLVDALLARSAQVRIVDDLTSGNLGNIQGHVLMERWSLSRRTYVSPALPARP